MCDVGKENRSLGASKLNFAEYNSRQVRWLLSAAKTTDGSLEMRMNVVSQPTEESDCGIAIWSTYSKVCLQYALSFSAIVFCGSRAASIYNSVRDAFGHKSHWKASFVEACRLKCFPSDISMTDNPLSYTI
jgi:hypothetical protein